MSNCLFFFCVCQSNTFVQNCLGRPELEMRYSLPSNKTNQAIFEVQIQDLDLCEIDYVHNIILLMGFAVAFLYVVRGLTIGFCGGMPF